MTQTTATIEAIKAGKQLVMTLIVVGGLSWVGKTYVERGGGTPDAPTPQTDLAALVDAEARPFLAGFYRDLAAVTEHPMIATSGQFRDTQQVAVKIAQATAELPSVAAINEPISKRIEAAIGLQDTALTNESRAALVATLESISGEFE